MGTSINDCIQRIVVYETAQAFYIVGANSSDTVYRILEVIRTPQALSIHDDEKTYKRKEIEGKLAEWKEQSKDNGWQKKKEGFLSCQSAFGILGFVRFLEGYYIILITKRTKVGVIGGHFIYKIEDTSMIYIPNNSKNVSSDESKYLRIFHNIDLSSNFYFSYTYDLTHSLQYNLTAERVQDGSNKPKTKFVWNQYLWEKSQSMVHHHWIIKAIHGFVGQSDICVFGLSLYIMLIARRSNQFAGTRFLKRGANAKGQAANEVETEQILYDASLMSLKRGRFTSYVQIRGSVPGSWSQDISSMVPKPPISLDKPDPYATVAAKHFLELFKSFGSPLIVVNLVKKREKRKRESLLTDELVNSVSYLNQFLPPKHHIQYRHLDMARCNKSPHSDVISKLNSIAKWVVKQTGLFLFGPALQPTLDVSKAQCQGENRTVCKQTGVLRTNCVDCLDRTNTAQLVVGKFALGHQLCSLGVISTTDLEFDTDVMRMLEDLYEDMGDTLAVQYGGSQLVHSLDSYRRVSPWTSHSRDIKQTLSRYYRNAFSDAEKQQAINLFLGVYKPSASRVHLWDLLTDYYIHNESSNFDIKSVRKSYTHWYTDDVIKSLPFSLDEMENAPEGAVKDVEFVDTYDEYYRPHEVTFYQDLFCFSHLPNSVRDYMPKGASDYSPFVVRVQQPVSKDVTHSITAKVERKSKAGFPKNSNDGTSSDDTSSSSSETSEDSSDDELSNSSSSTFTSLRDVFMTMKQTYGVEPRNPDRKDLQLYQEYTAIALNSHSPLEEIPSTSGKIITTCLKRNTVLKSKSEYGLNDCYCVTPPIVHSSSQRSYERYLNRGLEHGIACNEQDYALYKEYVWRRVL